MESKCMRSRISPRRDFSGNPAHTILSCSMFADTRQERCWSGASRSRTEVPGSVSSFSWVPQRICRLPGPVKSSPKMPRPDSRERPLSVFWQLPESPFCITRRCSLQGGRVDRVRFITHQGKQILFIDMTNCVSEEAMLIASEVRRVVTAQPRNSVLTLSDLTGGELRRDAITRMKEVAVFDRPYVKRAAIVGAESLPNVF